MSLRGEWTLMVVNEVNEFYRGAGGSPDAVADVAEKELGDSARVHWETQQN